MPERAWDVAVVGGGIVGLATARCLALEHGLRVLVLEAEDRIAAHQTGHNSGVVHSGLYYRPGSLKARNCVAGRRELEAYCRERGIPYERCGKVVVATREEQLPVLEELERRGRANGLEGVRRIGPEELAELEPHAAGIEALHVPETGIVDFPGVAAAFAADVAGAGGEVRTGARVTAIARDGSGLRLETAAGTVLAGALAACAGLDADRVARLAGLDPGIRIVPFRGEYHVLRDDRRHLVRNLIYPVPDPRFPFLGVHFTRRVTGEVEAGPNAVLALARHGYRKTDLSIPDTLATLTWPGFWRLALRHLPTGLAEQWRSLSRRAFVRSLQELVPEIRVGDVRPGGAGVRAQALDSEGNLLDDFHILTAPHQVHVLNAPSPAATASLAIARDIAARVVRS